MKTVVIGESSGASMETIMAVYPRHKAVVDTFHKQRRSYWYRFLSLTGAIWQYSKHGRQPKLLLNKTRLSWRDLSNRL
jgi:hypothetical protein